VLHVLRGSSRWSPRNTGCQPLRWCPDEGVAAADPSVASGRSPLAGSGSGRRVNGSAVWVGLVLILDRLTPAMCSSAASRVAGTLTRCQSSSWRCAHVPDARDVGRGPGPPARGRSARPRPEADDCPVARAARPPGLTRCSRRLAPSGLTRCAGRSQRCCIPMRRVAFLSFSSSSTPHTRARHTDALADSGRVATATRSDEWRASLPANGATGLAGVPIPGSHAALRAGELMKRALIALCVLGHENISNREAEAIFTAAQGSGLCRVSV
jgi:hypothetical protein